MPSHTLAQSFRCGVISLGLLTLTGCALLPAPNADHTRYYVITGLPPQSEHPAQAERTVVMGLKRIEMPTYLSGKNLVVRTEGNEITYPEFARWAEPLATSLSRALTEHLEASDKIARVYTPPLTGNEAREYDLAVSITRCEGERLSDGSSVARFVAVFELISAKPGGAVVLRKTFIAPEIIWDGRDFGALATALSAGVKALGNEMVNSLPSP